MDAKITLSFDAKVIERAKKYAEQQNISLSRLMELVLDKITSNNYQSFEDFPISEWVNQVAEGPATYVKSKKRSKLKKEYYESRRRK